jgi:protein tyrosine phosphatase
MIISDTPFAQAYWVRPGQYCGSQYPGALNREERDEKLRGLVTCGIRRVISLIPEHETGRGGQSFAPYQERLQEIANRENWTIECLRHGIPDAGVPSVDVMVAILNLIDASIAAAEPVCVHCWGGHGRTGTVAACHLVRHGMDPEDAIQRILELRQPLPKSHDPFEGGQKGFIRAWNAGQ